MGDGTKIEWTDATANVVNGCSLASPGCTNCYAMKMAGTRLRTHPSRKGLTTQTKAGPVWNGIVRFNERALQDVLGWKKPRMIFWNAHGDLFHESVPDEWIDRCFAAMAATPHHIHQVLTKRSARMRAYLSDAGVAGRVSYEGRAGWPLRNVWLGVSVEDQDRADERIPDLLAAPAAIRWLSCEPLLGPIDLTAIDVTASERGAEPSGLILLDALTGVHRDADDSIEGVLGCPDPHLDWIVVGGESGSRARPMHPAWARSLRDQCSDAGVPFLFKQWGEWHPSEQHADCEMREIMAFRGDHSQEWRPGNATYWAGQDGWQGMCRIGKKAAGRRLDGIEHNDFPQESK